MTRNLALEWGTDYDIRVNGIAPGPIGDTAGMSKLAPDEISKKMNDYMPLYKLGEKWDIAMAAVYLASDAGTFSFRCFLNHASSCSLYWYAIQPFFICYYIGVS